MILWAGLGAALGAGARVAIYAAMPLYGTLLANGIGSLAVGILAGLPLSDRARAFTMTGFCGGFTTFSLFGFETLGMLQARAYPEAAFYVGATLALALGGVALGLCVGRRIHPARHSPPD